MEARLFRTAALAALLLVSMGARFQSTNYIVDTADPRLAQQIAQAAEKYRHDLAIEWLGQAMPNWASPCMMTVQVGPNLGAGGATTFVFDRGEVFGWRMTIQGSAERIFDSVLPHEITHMIYATRFRRPLPRWADEGGATSMECASEKQKHRTMLMQFLRTGRGIAFSQLFAMTDYPRDVMPLYAEGYSLAEYLLQHGGRRKYVEFLDDGLKTNQWAAAVERHYGIGDLGTLQNTWLAWVRAGFPTAPAATAVAATAPQASPTDPRRPRPEPNLLYREPNDHRVVSASGAGMTPVTQTAASAMTPAPQATAPLVLPASGWRPSGVAAQPIGVASEPALPASAPQATEATRPPAMEPSKQMILQ